MSRGFLNYEVGEGQVVEDEVGRGGQGPCIALLAPPSLPSLQPPVPAVNWVTSPLCCHSKHPVLTHIHNVHALCGNSFFACLSPLDSGLFENKDCDFYPCIQSHALGLEKW